VLRGAGAALALPFLDAMEPAFAAAEVKKAPVRLGFIYVPNGIIMPEWTPKTTGAGYEMGRVLKPLESLRNDFFILSGLSDHNGNALGDGPGDHARAGASFLTGVHCKKTAGADIHNGISADQIAAQALSSVTRLPSLELGCEDSRTVGNCDSGYSCAYTNSISWRSATTPMPPEVDPRLAFERLFGASEGPSDPASVARRAAARKSILDAVGEETRALSTNLGAPDRRKIDEYLTAVREIERRIQTSEKEITPGLEKPTGIPIDFKDYLNLMFDLQLVAWQADITRVGTLMIGREGSLRTYPEIGVPDPHHPLTHHRNNPEWIEKVTKINCLHTEMLAGFLKRLKNTPDRDGNLLDHSMIVYGSGLSDGNAHLHERLPVLLAGRGDGTLKPGRHLTYEAGTPMTNLYATLLDRMGVRPETLGDTTGKLTDLSL
jgi:hypothetical protein